MKIHLRDLLWLIFFLACGLTWLQVQRRQVAETENLQRQLASAKRELKLAEKDRELWLRNLQLTKDEWSRVTEEIFNLRQAIKRSLDDQREWFELEVRDKRLVAIRSATSGDPVTSLETVEKVESTTGLDARRLKHFMTPIQSLQIK